LKGDNNSILVAKHWVGHVLGGSMSENLKERIDVYKIRIEDQDRNYFSLRDLEWRMALQFLFGYVTVGVGYQALRAKDGPSLLLTYWPIGLTIVLFLAYIFFSLCIQQRLHLARDIKNDYVKKLHDLIENTKVDHEEERKSRLRLPGWYAFLTQITVHTLAVATVIAYVVWTSR
jgi:hypothetical protein